ncbi:MAG: hypothetical protein NTW57_06625 [Methylophilales bacterium]|nr:hypothetical protein [Methylophilales bacterium]
MKKILLSITALTLPLFLVTNALAGPDGVRGSGGVGSYDFKWYQGAEGKDIAATVAPKSKKIAHSDVKAKTPDAVDSADHDAGKGKDKVAGDHSDDKNEQNNSATVAPKSKKMHHSKTKSENK